MCEFPNCLVAWLFACLIVLFVPVLWFHLYVCMLLSVSVYLSVCLSVFLSVFLSVSACLHVFLSVSQSVDLSVCLCGRVYTRVSIVYCHHLTHSLSAGLLIKTFHFRHLHLCIHRVMLLDGSSLFSFQS